MSFRAGVLSVLFCISIIVLIIDLFSNKFLNAFFKNFASVTLTYLQSATKLLRHCT